MPELSQFRLVNNIYVNIHAETDSSINSALKDNGSTRKTHRPKSTTELIKHTFSAYSVLL